MNKKYSDMLGCKIYKKNKVVYIMLIIFIKSPFKLRDIFSRLFKNQ